MKMLRIGTMPSSSRWMNVFLCFIKYFIVDKVLYMIAGNENKILPQPWGRY
jgi:hypothetical protein